MASTMSSGAVVATLCTAESVSADKLVWVDRPEPDMTVRVNYDRCAG